jgi:hypothetical protein
MMPAIQKLVYDACRAFGYAYESTDRDGSIDMLDRATKHRLCIYPSGKLYEVRGGKFVSVTFS